MKSFIRSILFLLFLSGAICSWGQKGEVKVEREVSVEKKYYLVEVHIKKGARKGMAEWVDSIPDGCTATPRESAGGKRAENGNLFKLVWFELPKKPSFKFHYQVSCKETDKPGKLKGKFMWIEDNKNRFEKKQTASLLPIIKEKPSSGSSKKNTTSTKPKITETSAEKTSSGEYTYKVQVGVYGEKTMGATLKEKYSLEEIDWYRHEGYYKFTSGSFKEKEKALQHMRELRKKGIEGSFVVSFKAGKRAQ